jgi:branched-chain amino acid transport system ATP-binding protein
MKRETTYETRRPDALLEVSGLGMQFGGLKALDKVSLSVERGEFVGIIGPNGAGKTTFFHAISGVLVPSSGEVRIAGHRMNGKGPDAFCQLGVARTFQTPRVFGDMSVRDNVRFAHTFGGKRDSRVHRGSGAQRIEDALQAVGIEGALDEPAGSLPPARQRQLEIAMALATEPRLLLLDEVAAGLTEGEVESVARLIGRLRSQYGLTVVWIEHAVKTLMQAVDRVAVLNFGQLLADGTPAQIAADARVVDAYLGEEAQA